MRQGLRDVFRGPVVFYPLLFAAFPVLFLYAHNISQTSASQVLLPLGISVGGAIVLWAVLSLILRSLAKAALATAVFLALFFSYGRLHHVLTYQGFSVSNHAFLLPATLFIWGCCVYFIGRAKRDFRITTRLLNVVAVALIAISLFSIGSYRVTLARAEEMEPPPGWEQTHTADPAESSALPDIYLIIPDEYAHHDTMLEYYDYDNSEFIEGLEARGFFIAHDSRTPTGSTEQVLAGVLNMQYVDAGVPSDHLYRMIAYNEAARFLKTLGYRFIYFGQGYDFGRWHAYMNESADDYFNYREGPTVPWISEFQEVLWNTTMLKPLYYHMVGAEYETAWRRQTLSTLEHLKDLPREEGPRFVVAHLICPHEPFVFGPEGQHVAAVNWANYEDRQFYLGQYIFISTRIDEVVDALLAESETPPIIIIQSDHGIRPHHHGIVIGAEEWRKILNAMYLPGMDYSELSDAILPVNTFRLIFSHYFGADYELLEDG